MKVTDVVIDVQKTMGKKLLLVDVVPVHVYADGKRTDEVNGFRYVIVMPEKKFKKIAVKIDGDLKLKKPEDGYIDVKFTNLELSIYWAQGDYQISAKATDIVATTKQ